MNTSNSPLHVIVGAGQVGSLIAERLVARGLRARVVRRSDALPSTSGVEFTRADVADAQAAARAFEGAAVVYHTAVAPYHRWATELVPLNRGIAEGARAIGARVVVLDNLYVYGQAPGGIMREDTPVAPCSKKGEFRRQAADIFWEAKARGLQMVLARAADFIGPGATQAAIFGARFWPRLLAGKPVELVGDPTLPHAYSYTPDVADGLVTLGLSETASDWGRVWHLPVLRAESTQTWVDRLAAELGKPARTTILSPLMFRLIGLFVPEAGEVREMLYQWRSPFIVDDAAFRARFGSAPTPASEVVRATLAWARATYGGAAAAPRGDRTVGSAPTS